MTQAVSLWPTVQASFRPKNQARRRQKTRRQSPMPKCRLSCGTFGQSLQNSAIPNWNWYNLGDVGDAQPGIEANGQIWRTISEITLGNE
jgi:hypothetical protein